MSQLIRCDKCKVELPKSKKVKRIVLHDLVVKENWYDMSYYTPKIKEKKLKTIHLCKKCLEKFEIWLDL